MELQETPTTNSELDILVRTKKQIEYSLENLVNAIEKGIMNRTTQSRMQDLENQIDEIDKKILIEKSKTKNKVSESDIRKYLADALKMQALYLIQTLIKQIKMFNDKIEIIFNCITNKSPNDEGSFLFAINKEMVKVIQNKVKPNMIAIFVEFYI